MRSITDTSRPAKLRKISELRTISELEDEADTTDVADTPSLADTYYRPPEPPPPPAMGHPPWEEANPWEAPIAASRPTPRLPQAPGGRELGLMDTRLPGELTTEEVALARAAQAMRRMQGGSPAIAEMMTRQANPPTQPIFGQYQGPEGPIDIRDPAKAKAYLDQFRPVDPSIEAIGKGLASGLTAGTYQPQIDPEQALAGTIGQIGGAVGGGLLSALGGPAGITSFQMLAYLNDLKSRGIDPARLTEPEFMALAATSGMTAAALPGSFGASRLRNLGTGVGLGAGTEALDEATAAAATGTEADYTMPLILGGAFGLGAGMGTPLTQPAPARPQQPPRIDDVPSDAAEPTTFQMGPEAPPPPTPEGAAPTAPLRKISEVFTDEDVEARVEEQFPTEQPPPPPEAPAPPPPPPPPRPERMVTPDNPYQQGGEGGSLKEALYGNNVRITVTDDVRNQLGLWHHLGGDKKRPWSLKEIRQNFPRIQWSFPQKMGKKQDPFNTLREVANEGGYGLLLDGKHHTEIDDNDVIDAIAGGPPQEMRDDARLRYRPAPEPAIDRGIPEISDEDAKAMEAADARVKAEEPIAVVDERGYPADWDEPAKAAAKKATDTPEFKAWFGDSKVVDESGKPQVVYHGTTGDFNEFQQKVRHHGGGEVGPTGTFFFAREPAVANYFSRDRAAVTKKPRSVMPVYLRLENPIDLRDMEVARGVVRRAGYTDEGLTQQLAYALLDNKEIVNMLKREGYDGAFLVESGRPFASHRKALEENYQPSDELSDFSKTRQQDAETIAVFSPNQIKSAIGNRGTFDIKSRNITESIGQQDMFGGEEAPKGRPKPKAEQVDMFAGERLTPDQGPIKGGTKGLEGLPLQEGADKAAQAEGQTELLSMADREAALRRGARAEEMVIGDEDIPRVQVAKRLRKVTDDVAAGKLEPEAAVKEAAKIADEVSTASLARRFKKDIAPRQRGYDIVREKIIAARRRGEIDHHQAEMALWFMSKNPDVVEELGISVKGPGKKGTTAGTYNAAEQVMTLMKGNDASETAVHEILHHTERMMPEKVRAGILKEWAKDLAREYSGASFKKLKALHEISEVNAGRGTYADLLKKFKSGEIPHELYKYFDTSEYWAVNGARILSNRYAASESWIAQARQWFKEFVQKARGLVGLKSDAPILRALDAIRKSEGTRQTERMLHQEQGGKRGPILRDIADQEAEAPKAPAKEPPAAKEPPKEPPKGPPKPPEKPQQEIFQKDFELSKENLWNAMLRRVQDKMRPLKRVQRAIEATGKKVSEATNAYLADTLYHGRTGDALKQAETRFTDRVLKSIKDAGFTREQVDDYLLARHAKEANAHIHRINPDPKRHFGMSNEEAEAILKKAKEDGTTEKLEAIGKQVDEAVNYGLDYAVREGIISEEQAANWRSSYKHYVPAKGLAESDIDDPNKVGSARLGQGYDIRGKEEQMRKGRLGRPDSPLANVFAQLSTRIIRAEKNRVGKSFLKMVVDNPNKDLWEVNKLTPKQTFDGSVVKQGFTLTKDHPNVVSVKVKGQEYYVYVHDTRLAQAMKNQGEEKVNKLVQGMGKVNRYLAAVSTTYNPVFGVLNFMRDFQTAGINMTADKGAKFTGKVYKDVLTGRAMRGVLAGQKARKTLIPEKKVDEWAGWYKRFAAAGGKTEYLDFNSVDDLKKRFDAKLKPGAFDKGMAPFKWLGEQVSDINGAVENAIRLSAFKRMVEDGASDAEAAAYAKTLTVDFNRKGEIGSFMNAAYLFFNANTQGIHRILSVMAKPETTAGKRMWAIAGTLAAGSAALTVFNRANAGEDEDGINRYDKLPPFVKERNLIFWMPGEDAPYTIPIPYGYNLLNVMGQTAVDLKQSTRDTDEIASNAMMAIFSAFNPLGTESSAKPATKGLVKLLSPTQLDPLAQLAVNEDFTGKPIMPEQLPLGTPKPQSELHFKSVSPMAKGVAKKLNEIGGGNEFVSGEVDVGPFKVGTDVSPEAMEHMVTAFTGGLGKFLYQSADYARSTLKGKETDVSKTPFVRSFKQGKSEYFDQREFVDKSARYLQFAEAADKMSDAEAEAFEAKHAEAIELGYHARDVKKEIEDLSKEAREVRTDQDMSEEQKEAELEDIEAEKTKLRREWNGARVKLVNKKKEELVPAAP